MAKALDRAAVRGVRPSHVHVIGAGLAGLAAALSLVEAGVRVTVHESGPAAGGRCRSYFDRELGCRVDNGNHLLLSGNRAAFGFLDQVGSRATLTGPGQPRFPFMDVRTGERWTLRPNRGRLPWWILRAGRRVPGTRAADYLGLARLRFAGPDATVGGALRDGMLYRRLLEPLAIAALNTPPKIASARLLGAVVNETLAAGGAACIPAYPAEGLSETFIDPAIAWLEARGASVRFGNRVASLAQEGARVTRLDDLVLGPDEAVVLAVPPTVATALVPCLPAPDRFEAILNVHFRLDAERGEAGFVGVIGGTAEWLFVKPGHVSVTISAANRAIDTEPVALAQQVWQDVCTILRLSQPMPAWRVVKEKRATFAATPDQDRRRPPPETALANLVVAGDWTATGLPATIEGAIRSGRRAADCILTAPS